MPEATLSLTMPEQLWIGDVSRSHPEATFRVLSAIPQDDGRGVALVELTSDAVEALISDMRDRDEITDLEVLNDPDGSALVQFETSTPMLLLLMRDSGVPLELPFDISDGEALWEITATHESISDLSEKLDTFGISFTVESLRYEVGEDRLLTESQRDLLETAVEMGYYDSPRRCSLTDLAEAVGRAKSTVSETLHRAEGAVIREYANAESCESEVVPSADN